MSIFEKLCEQLLMPSDELRSFVSSAPFRYKRYFIQKRNSKELRLIAHPARTVKSLQRFVVKELEPILPIHEKAMAYCQGRGIKENAASHINSRYILKMDLKDFFGSIKPEILFRIFDLHQIVLTDDDKFLLSNLLFWKLQRNSPLRLSVGAPSSPFISNVVMYFFDIKISEFCAVNKITYTRYADDLTFSTSQTNILKDVERAVIHCLNECFGRDLRINPDKTVHSSKAHNRHVTGVTLTNDRKLSLGRERKRTLSATVHAYSLGKLDKEKIMKLKGNLGFAKHIEPLFIQRLIKKYGNDIIAAIQNFEPTANL